MLESQLIVGRGEVGTALASVLGCDAIDKQEIRTRFFDVLHICFPFSEGFVAEVQSYQSRYQPRLTVIHATVPVGTSRACGAVHSPIRGQHPRLVEGLAAFVKLVGGTQASQAGELFRRAGLRVLLFEKPETTEAAKLWDSEYYRTCIAFTRRVKTFCEAQGLNFHEVYTLPNQTYNAGYAALGHPEFVRPVLAAMDPPIGGHCVEANHVLLERSC